jgi:hypothetical protein
MAEKTKKPGFFSRYIGGLLGEDAESMTEDDRRRATLSLLGAIGRNYLSPGSGDESLAAMRASRAAERKAVDDARRTAAAQAMMPDIASRIFGGTGGRSIEALPGVGGEAMPMTSRRVPTREGAREALGMLYGTQEGRDAATMAPGLVDVAKEGVTGRIVGGSVYDTMTGRFDAPRTPPKPKTIVGEVDLTDRVIVSYSDGTEKTFMKGAAPRAAGGGGERFKILSPTEVLEAGLKPGAVYQQNTVTGLITPMQGVDSGGLGETELRQYNAADLAIKNARSNIQNLTDTLARVPATSAIAGEGRGELEGAYTLALGAVRELQNSGVLNVGEIPFLEKALRDPTTFSAIAASPLKRKELAGQIRTIMTLLAQKESNLNKVYFPGKPPPQNANPSAANPVVPTNQNRAPNPAARSRAENYYQAGD